MGAGGRIRESLKHGKGVTGLGELRTGSIKGKICDTFLSLNLSLSSNGNYLSLCVCVGGGGGSFLHLSLSTFFYFKVWQVTPVYYTG